MTEGACRRTSEEAANLFAAISESQGIRLFVPDALACHPTANPHLLATSPIEAEKAKLSFLSPPQQGGGGTALAHDIEEVEVC